LAGAGRGRGAMLRCRADVGENFVHRAWFYHRVGVTGISVDVTNKT